MKICIDRKWCELITSQTLLSLFVIALMDMGMIPAALAGGLCLLFILPQLLLAFKKNLLFTPITPAFIFEVCLALYLMRLVNTYTELPLETMLVMVMCMYLWKMISVSGLGFKKHEQIEQTSIKPIPQNTFTLIVTALFLISLAAMAFEWYKAGGIPAFRSDSETFRFLVSYSAITHILAIMNKMVAIIIGAYLINKGKIQLRQDFILIFEMIVAELLMYGTAFRGEMILAPCALFIFYAIRHKVPLKFYVIAGIFALGVIGVFPIVRMYNAYGVHYFVGQRNISTYPQLFFLTPMYQSFTNNFEVFNLDVSIFPDLMPFGLGIYSILPQIPFFDFGASLGSVQNEVLNNGFYANLTATYLSVWYADFGYLGCLLVTLIFAGLTNYSYKLCLKKRSLTAYVWYAYTFYIALWIFYSSTFDFVYVCYSLVIFFAYKFRMWRTLTNEIADCECS